MIFTNAGFKYYIPSYEGLYNIFIGSIIGRENNLNPDYLFLSDLHSSLCMGINYSTFRSDKEGILFNERLYQTPIRKDVWDADKKRIPARNMIIVASTGGGKSVTSLNIIQQNIEQNYKQIVVEFGKSFYQLSQLYPDRSLHIDYDGSSPLGINPFYTADGLFDIEKRESVKTLILTLWKRDDEPPSRSEEVALSNAVNLYLEHIGRHPEHKPSFNGFYRFVGRDYRRLLRQKNVREKDFDIDNFLTVLEPYYEGGEYDYLLNSDKELDLLHKRFIVFELDNIKDHKILLPIVTIIIMETYIGKMRRLKGVRKVILIEECWKALTSANMSEYIRYLYKTVRKYFGEAVIVTQEVDDIISSPIVKETIINNADCKILLDQRKYINKFDQIQTLLGLTEKEKAQILSINLSNDPSRRYKEVWIGLGGVQSAVYATEVSDEEYYCYTTEESEKAEVFALAEKLDGDLEAAIRQLARKRRMKSDPL